MSQASNQFKTLSPLVIEASHEIQQWVAQFSNGQRATAKLMLSRLKFVSRDVYSAWLRKELSSLPKDEIHALYSVRKLADDQRSYWCEDGSPALRPGSSLGSEDLVYSIVSNLVRSDSKRYFDHPTLSNLKASKVHSYVLIDDSIGSGDRVAGFINAILNHPTFLSWWSFGWIKFHVLSFARSGESEEKIISQISGSDHGQRKFKKSSKIVFTSNIVYQSDWLEFRWGESYRAIKDICNERTEISRWECFGYGDVMANIVFYHSVPDNLPGILWCDQANWKGLMPGRSMPTWLLSLIDNCTDEVASQKTFISDEMLRLLALIKRGVRSTKVLAIRISIDHKYAVELIRHATLLGLLTQAMRLTPTGIDQLKKSNQITALPSWDYSLYTPKSWCAGQATVQPSIQMGFASAELTDSVEVSTSADGDVGQTSLEGSDAKAATPPICVMSHLPSVSRKKHDTNGPKGPKER